LRELFLGDPHGGTGGLVVAGAQPTFIVAMGGSEDLRDQKRLKLLSRLVDPLRAVLLAAR
jgi:hypothetical protein